MLGKISDTSIPFCPYFWKLNGVGIKGPGFPCRTIISPLPVSGCPAYRRRAGLGSKVSTWLTPPDMNSEITLVARGAKCGFFGVNGVGPDGLDSHAPAGVERSAASKPCWSSSQASATPDTPPPAWNKKSRLDRKPLIVCTQTRSDSEA